MYTAARMPTERTGSHTRLHTPCLGSPGPPPSEPLPDVLATCHAPCQALLNLPVTK